MRYVICYEEEGKGNRGVERAEKCAVEKAKVQLKVQKHSTTSMHIISVPRRSGLLSIRILTHVLTALSMGTGLRMFARRLAWQAQRRVGILAPQPSRQ